MLDLDRLFSAPVRVDSVPDCAQERGTKSAGGGEGNCAHGTPPYVPNETQCPRGLGPDSWGGGAVLVGHSGHSASPQKLTQCAQPEANNHAGSRGLGTGGTLGTVDFQGGGRKTMHGAPVEGAGRGRFALHPSAVCLLLAWAEKIGVSMEELAALLSGLGGIAPGEQVRHWHKVCLEAGLAPWRVLAQVADSEGMDCTLCKHLLSRFYPEPNSRRRFHWGCALGYLVLEVGRGTERIWIAPPECQSWERWKPGEREGGLNPQGGPREGPTG